MRLARLFSTLLAVALLAAACGNDDGQPGGGAGVEPGGGLATEPGQMRPAGPAIVITSFNFPESQILAEIYAGALRAAGYDVRTRLNLGSREIVVPALERGEVNFIPEYAGTSLEFLNSGAGEATSDTDATTARLRERWAERNVTVLEPAPGEDKNGFFVTDATAQQLGVSTLSDLSDHAGDLVLGGPPECPQRPFCLLGLEDVYDLEFRDFRALDTGGPLTVAALDGGEIDVALLFTSSGIIAVRGFVHLADDRGLQPAENVVPVVTDAVVEAYGDDFVRLVNSVSSLITTEELIELNKRADVDNDDPDQIAADWLEANGFTS